MDFKTAIKEQKTEVVSILRLIKTEVLNKEKNKRYKLTQENPGLSEIDIEQKSALSEEEILDIINSRMKKGREAIAMFEKGNRADLAEKEKKELEILKKYLPEQLPEEQVRVLAEAAVNEVGAKTMKDMGKVMAKLMPQVKGKADGSLVSKIIKELLS